PSTVAGTNANIVDNSNSSSRSTKLIRSAMSSNWISIVCSGLLFVVKVSIDRLLMERGSESAAWAHNILPTAIAEILFNTMLLLVAMYMYKFHNSATISLLVSDQI